MTQDFALVHWVQTWLTDESNDRLSSRELLLQLQAYAHDKYTGKSFERVCTRCDDLDVSDGQHAPVIYHQFVKATGHMVSLFWQCHV